MTLTVKQNRLATLIIDETPSSDAYEEQVILKKLYHNVGENDEPAPMFNHTLFDFLKPLLTSAEIVVVVTYLTDLKMINVSSTRDPAVQEYTLNKDVRNFVDIEANLF